MVMSKEQYKRYLHQLSNELLYNSSVSESILSGIMTLVTDINKYNYNDTYETVFTTNIE